jgi:hypothetical protein
MECHRQLGGPDNVLIRSRQPIKPARSPERWITSGLILQTAGVAGVVAYAWIRLRRQGIGGHLTASTFRLAWHADVHTRTGLIVLTAGAVIYAAGSVVMARPFLVQPRILFLAVPAAAVVGILALGALVLIVAVLLVVLANSGDLPLDFFDGGGGGRARRKKGPQI